MLWLSMDVGGSGVIVLDGEAVGVSEMVDVGVSKAAVSVGLAPVTGI